MRCTRNLFLATAMTVAAMLLAASSASAITIRQEPGNTACPAGPTVNAHVVSGGCHVTFASGGGGVPLLFHTGVAEVQISNCAVTGELRVNSAGVGFATNIVLTDITAGSCTRRPCDEANMAKLPWPAAIEGTVAAPTHEVTICIRTAASGEGGAATNCAFHWVIIVVGHTYSASSGGSESACETLPQIEITGSGSTTGTERIEIS